MPPSSIKIIYSDNQIMVIDKPFNLVVTPADSHSGETLSEILEKDYGITIERGGIVHRLDKDTSGIILAAKTIEAFEGLQAQFKDRTIKKEYLALVHGFVEESGVVEGAIERNIRNREKFIVSDTGKEAVTHYQPPKHYQMSEETKAKTFEGFNKLQFKKLERNNYGDFTLLLCKPQTGRTHQIRVHLKHIGFPIVGDQKYAGRKTARLDSRWCRRQFLHAFKISFIHPVTEERLDFTSELPEDLSASLDHLKERAN